MTKSAFGGLRFEKARFRRLIWSRDQMSVPPSRLDLNLLDKRGRLIRKARIGQSDSELGVPREHRQQKAF